MPFKKLPTPPWYFTVRQLSKLTGANPSTINGRIARGKIRSVLDLRYPKPQKTRLIPVDEAVKFHLSWKRARGKKVPKGYTIAGKICRKTGMHLNVLTEYRRKGVIPAVKEFPDNPQSRWLYRKEDVEAFINFWEKIKRQPRKKDRHGKKAAKPGQEKLPEIDWYTILPMLKAAGVAPLYDSYRNEFQARGESQDAARFHALERLRNEKKINF
ncbi:MAG: helix-turn-helix domain-containing protein [Candidatus Diapherotrites archaeon]